MFQFPRLPSLALCVQARIRKHYLAWVAPFGDLRVKRLCAANRSLSQLVTSFIDFLCQGIHRVPLISSSNKLLYRYLGISHSKYDRDEIKDANHTYLFQRIELNKWFTYLSCFAMQLSRCSKASFTRKNPRNRILWPKDKFDMTLHEFRFVSDPGGRSDLDYHMDSSFNEVSP